MTSRSCDGDIEAAWFDGGGGRRRRARLSFDGGLFRAVADDGEERQAAAKEIDISARLGDVPRQLVFPDGTTVSVEDNYFIDAALKSRGANWFSHFLYLAETRRRWLAVFLAAAAGFLYFFVAVAVPRVSAVIVDNISHQQLAAIGEEVYDGIKKHGLLQDSALSEPRRNLARTLFAEVVADAGDGYRYRLQFHRFGGAANAFALPDGRIIATDELVEVLDADELAAVFAHEIGHVEHRHGVRLFVQSLGLFSFLTLASGDVSGLLAGGVVLLNLKYSRDFESEADCFAYRYLRRKNLPPQLIGQALEKMENRDDETDKSPFRDDDAPSDAEETRRGVFIRIVESLSTHPATENRFNLREICR